MRYDLSTMKADLASQLEAYLEDRLDLAGLKRYAWEQEQMFEAVEDDRLPAATEDDRLFWAAIWDVINTGDAPPEHHPTRGDLRLHLACLRGQARLPSSVQALRPSRGRK
jgi:hypothetical protein